MQPKATNRSTAMTPELIAAQTAQMTEVCQESFELGVKAGTVELTLTDEQVEAVNKTISAAIEEAFEKYFARL